MIGNLFNPRSVAIVGASADESKMAGKPLVRLTQHRFGGEIYLVNPKYDSIAGRHCYSSVAEIKAPIDVALISLPAPKVPAAIRECGEAGVKYAVVISSGFGEDASAGELNDELMRAVQASEIRLVGPNCEGIWSTPARMALTFGSAADRAELLSGPVSVISQSGSIGGACMRRLQDLGIGCRYFVSSGNEADLSSMDYLEHLVDEGGSKVVAMFVEGIRDGARLQAIARRAALSGVRLIVLCGGTSESGRLATSSHTGKVASAAAVYRDLLERAGVLQVDTFTQFVDAIGAATFGHLPIPAAPSDSAVAATEAGTIDESGVSIVAMSGGSRALLADACARFGVPLAVYSEKTEHALDEMLPQFGYSRNPTDLTGQVLADPPLFGRVLQTVAEDPKTEAMIVQYANGADRQLAPQLELFRDLAADSSKPIVVSLLGAVSDEIVRTLQDYGVLTVHDPDDAVEYLSWLFRWREFSRRAHADLSPTIVSQVPSPMETWSERMDLLEQAHIDVPGWRIWNGPESSFDGLRYPLVVKALPGITEHKTESGLVFLGIRDKAELDATLEEFRAKVPPGTPALIQEMITDGVEVLVAARTDPDFGPVLAIGAGGILTEWLRDIAYVQLPATESQLRDAISGLRLWTLLQSFRGRPAADIQALVDVCMNLGRAFLEHALPGSEIELNPVLARSSGAMAVDILCAVPTDVLALS